MTREFGSGYREWKIGGGILAVLLALGFLAYDQRPYAGVVESKHTTRETVHTTRSDGSTRRERRTRYVLGLRSDAGKPFRRKVSFSLYQRAEEGDRVEKRQFWTPARVVTATGTPTTVNPVK